MRPNIKHVLVVAGLALSALFLWFALRNVDGETLWNAMRRTEPAWISPFLLSLVAFCWLKSARWAVLLASSRHIQARELVAPVVIGYMGTGLMPMQLGELARAYLAATSLGMRMAAVLASLLIERILDVMVLLLILALVAVFGAGLSAEYQRYGIICAVVVVCAGIALWSYAAHTQRFIAAVGRVLRILPQSIQARIVDQLKAGATGLQILRETRRFWLLATLSLLQWACMCLCTWISLAAIGQFVHPIAALAVLATTIVSMTLPSGPGYVGAIQLAYVLALAPFGVAASDALAASFFYLATLWVPLVLVGLVLLHRRGLRLGALANTEKPAGSG